MLPRHQERACLRKRKASPVFKVFKLQWNYNEITVKGVPITMKLYENFNDVGQDDEDCDLTIPFWCFRVTESKSWSLFSPDCSWCQAQTQKRRVKIEMVVKTWNKKRAEQMKSQRSQKKISYAENLKRCNVDVRVWIWMPGVQTNNFSSFENVQCWK